MKSRQFATGEYHHLFNRGVDKRQVFLDEEDFRRFLQGMREFNTIDPIGSLYEESVRRASKKLGSLTSKNREPLVSFIAYCLNPNHFHFIVKQLADNGIEKFMHRLGTGYSKYFNTKYQRTGALFQGTFKRIHIDSDRYLLHASAYVNLNNRVHGIEGENFRSSWNEYIGQYLGEINFRAFCDKEVILSQFSNTDSYRGFAERSLGEIRERKELQNLEV